MLFVTKKCVMKQKLYENSKTHIVTKLKNSPCDRKKFNFEKFKKYIVKRKKKKLTKLKSSNSDKTPKTQIVTKL